MKEFSKRIKQLIKVFNEIYNSKSYYLSELDKNKFSYLLVRRIKNFWNRSNISRQNFKIWMILLWNIKFMNPFKVLKSCIK
jgi:hypothetical protein